MADSISYTPTTWADGADGGTPITAARLNNIEQGVSAATKQVNANANSIKTLGDSVSQVNFQGVQSVDIFRLGNYVAVVFHCSDAQYVLSASSDGFELDRRNTDSTGSTKLYGA